MLLEATSFGSCFITWDLLPIPPDQFKGAVSLWVTGQHTFPSWSAFSKAVLSKGCTLQHLRRFPDLGAGASGAVWDARTVPPVISLHAVLKWVSFAGRKSNPGSVWHVCGGMRCLTVCWGAGGTVKLSSGPTALSALGIQPVGVT